MAAPKSLHKNFAHASYVVMAVTKVCVDLPNVSMVSLHAFLTLFVCTPTST